MNTTKNDACPIDEIFLPDAAVREIVSRFGTPLFLYDGKGLCESAKSLLSLFPDPAWRQYVPAWVCPREGVLKLLSKTGLGIRCQTERELELALNSGFSGQDILYSAAVLTTDLSRRLRELDIALAAAGDPALPSVLPKRVLLQVWVPRGKGTLGADPHHRPGIGFSAAEIPAALERLCRSGAEESGFLLRYDAHAGSDVFLSQQTAALVKLARRLQDSPLPIGSLHLDGGFNPSRNRTKLLPSKTEAVVQNVLKAAEGWEKPVSFCLPDLLLQPNCLYFAKVLGLHERFSPMVVTDADSTDLHLPAANRYFHISLLGKRQVKNRMVCDIMGNTPRMADWLGKCRILPQPEPGDIVVFHDVGSSISPSA